MHDYELIYIVRPDAQEEAFTAVTERVAGWLTANGGQITRTDVWGRRQMAYSIKKYREGQYVLVEVQLQPNAVREIERNLKLNEDILRFLVVRKDS